MRFPLPCLSLQPFCSRSLPFHHSGRAFFCLLSALGPPVLSARRLLGMVAGLGKGKCLGARSHSLQVGFMCLMQDERSTKQPSGQGGHSRPGRKGLLYGIADPASSPVTGAILAARTTPASDQDTLSFRMADSCGSRYMTRQKYHLPQRRHGTGILQLCYITIDVINRAMNENGMRVQPTSIRGWGRIEN